MPYAEILLEAVKRSGRSARDISLAATGHESAVRDLKRGRDIQMKTAVALCRELGLEFYIGPPRVEALDFERLGPAPGETGGARRADIAGNIRRAIAGMARAAIGLGHNPIEPELWPVLLAHAGETLPAGNESIAAAADSVTVIELEATAGAGTGGELFREEQKGLVWFRRGWLERRGLEAANCVIMGVRGKAMQPHIPDGCSILVDRASREWIEGRILVIWGEEIGLAVKRAAEDENGARIMISDNPYWPDVPLPAGARIIGRVRWLGYGVD